MSSAKKLDPLLIRMRVNLPEPLHKKIEEHLHDPVRGRRAYGAFSSLVQQLLQDWVKEKEKFYIHKGYE